MRQGWKVAVVCLLVLTMLATIGVGCGKKGEEKVTITIGQLNDLTGPAASICVPITTVLQDLCRYYNEENLIPGVKLKVATYDTSLNPAKELPGYYWVRERGAQVVTDVLPTSIILKPFATRDKVPLFSYTGLKDLLFPTSEVGYGFCLMFPDSYALQAVLKWVSENDWDYQAKGRKPKLGAVGAALPNDVECLAAVNEYAQANPDEFDYVGGYSSPVGTTLWSGTVAALKECDYVVLIHGTGVDMATFVEQYRASGGAAKFLGANQVLSWTDLLVAKVGWEGMNGSLTAFGTKYWWEDSPITTLAKEILDKYHHEGANAILEENLGMGYMGAFHQAKFLLDLLAQVVKDVGAENVNAQAIYNTAIGFHVTYEGYPEWGYTETVRAQIRYVRVLEWKAAESRKLVPVSDWLPLPLGY
jgi:ABC-type branched-subunit amino acid transport system substrate-binding protein